MIATGMKLGRYEVRSLIGTGGMGEVYLAEDGDLRRKVAIKVLPDELITDEKAGKRLLREARAAATLDHPNICSVYEVGEGNGLKFIAMQFIEGESLDEKIRRNALDLRSILHIAVQLADALTEAHSKGIIHRDIKPANIMVTSRGDAKLMDLGLVKLESTVREIRSQVETVSLLSGSGVVIGTVPYMSPEQVRGKPVDARSDLFSFGVVLYEMLSGERPFKGESFADTASSILTTEPPPLTRYVNDLPAELQRIVEKLLHKDPDDRYQTARDLLIDLRTLRDELEFQHRLERSGAPDAIAPSNPITLDRSAPVKTEILPAAATGSEIIEQTAEAGEKTLVRTARMPKWQVWVVAAVVIAAAVAGGAWLRNRSNVNWARSQVPRIEELVKSGKYFAAFDLASDVQKYLPGDPNLNAVMPTISDTISVSTDPAGARVFLRRYDPDDQGKFPERRLIGTTPIGDVSIPRGPHILYIEKEGYAPVERSVLGAVMRTGGFSVLSPPISIEQRLIEEGAVPENMVFVPGGDYRLVSWNRPTDDKARLDDYFIDKYEVSNREFKEFVSAGGYVNREYWKVPFVKDSRTLSWEEAMAVFKDRTGLPGPREWRNQDFPDGKADHPVTGVTWYEAAAYAEFRGKTLPTIYQWEKAARNGMQRPITWFMPWGAFAPGDSLQYRANFETNGTMPVNSGEFGLSPFGALNMAGNVSEWTLNEKSDGFIGGGGSWGEPYYMFSYAGAYPGFFSSEKRGFRCAKLADPEKASGDQGGAKIEKKDEIPEYRKTTDAEFRKLAEAYRYEKTPLDPEIVEVTETADWRREKITFNGAAGERAMAYLYLPKIAARPLQVVNFIPGGDVDGARRSISASTEDRLASVIKSGRAVFGVVIKNYIERRPKDFAWPEDNTVEYREFVVNQVTDIRRGIDYLETRDDLDPGRIGFFGSSAGARLGLILAAVENRYKSIFFMGCGVLKADMDVIPEANQISFTPHIRGPIYILNGRYDENIPLKTHAEPMFKLMREPKHLEIFEGGHVAPLELLVPSLNKFLDETLGPVRRQ